MSSMIAELTKVRPLAVPLTILHYGMIGLRQAHMRRRFPPRTSLDQESKDIVRRLERDGWATIENYISESVCSAVRNRIDEIIVQRPPRMKMEYAGAEYRYFGAEDLDPLFSEYYRDPFLHSVAEGYLRTEVVNTLTLMNKSLPASSAQNIHDRWHRDSFGRQLKAIAYMCDVDDHNGPFEFVPGSHRFRQIVADVHQSKLRALQWRLTDNEVDELVRTSGAKPVKFLAPAGSVVLVDTSIVHRACPITDGVRYALTNYYTERARYRVELCESHGVAFRPELAP